jgi:hypothetical protein
MNTKYIAYLLLILYVIVVLSIVVVLFPDNFLSAIIPGIIAAVLSGLVHLRADIDSLKDERTLSLARKSSGNALIFFIFIVPILLILTMTEIPMFNTGFSLLLLYFMTLTVWWISIGYYYKR